MILGYWAIKGRAEPILCLAAHLGINIVEKRYTEVEEWNTDIQNKIVDLPNLPYLIDGDVKLTQSHVIATYLCEKAGKQEIFGKTTADKLKVLELIGTYDDFFDRLKSTFSAFAQGLDPFKEAFAEACTKGRPHQIVKYLSQFLGNKDFFLGYLTYADILIATNGKFADVLCRSIGTTSPFTSFENTDALIKRVFNLNGIKQRVATAEWKALPWTDPNTMPIPLLE